MTEVFGAVVRGRRIESGLTQHDLARLTDVSVRTIRAIERGRVSRPHRRTTAALSSALGLSPERRGRYRGLEVRVLGPLEVVRDGQVVEVGAPMQRCLLGLLALKAGRVARMDEIAETLWAHRPPARWANLIHTYVARLRRTTGSPAAIAAGPGGYRLRTDHVHLDLTHFEHHLSQALTHPPRTPTPTRNPEHVGPGLVPGACGECVRWQGVERAFGLLDVALGLWRGTLLEDLPCHLRDQLTPLTVTIEERYVAATLAHADAATATGNHERTIPVLAGLSRSRPLHEGLQARLMIALALAGRQADALDLYASTCDRLRRDLGVDPGPELRDSHLHVLRQTLPARLLRTCGHPTSAPGSALQEPWPRPNGRTTFDPPHPGAQRHL